jgi:cobaltochelatase CobS
MGFKIGEEVALVNFTGKLRLDTVTINDIRDELFYVCDLKNGTEGHFSIVDGKQINAAVPKYASYIIDLANAPEKQPRKKSKKVKEIDFNPAPTVKHVPGKVRHEKHEIILSCVKENIPVYLVGEAGTGKNHTLQEVAEDLNLQFYFTNSVQQEYKLTGFIDAGGVFHETEFYKAFKDGGLFFLDEIDASIPEVLVLLNAAIANRYFEFPNGRIDAHPDFRVVAAGNTCGSGADELYTGRLVLDSATLDRFVVIEFDYDRNIELHLAEGNEALVNFVRSMRKFAKENGVRATFSYRCIISVTKLEKARIDLKTILQIAVFKGLDKDTVNMFKSDYSIGSAGRYYYALKELQAS